MNINDMNKINEEIIQYKKINNRNNVIIIALLAILLFVCVMMVYVRFFGQTTGSFLQKEKKLDF